MKQISEDAAALQDMMQNVNSLLGEQKGTIEKIEVLLFWTHTRERDNNSRLWFIVLSI